jgi:hypothetical protein
MGCNSSAHPIADESQLTKKADSREGKAGKRGSVVKVSATHTQISNHLCPHIRLDCQDSVKTLYMTGERYTYDMKYCYVSQRGYYPNSLDKANQDSYLICESILGDSSCHLFGIFDGHGEVGDYCSHFAADQVMHLLVL